MVGKERTQQSTLAAGVPLGTVIPRSLTDDSRIVVLHRPKSAPAERYRRLCAMELWERRR